MQPVDLLKSTWFIVQLHPLAAFSAVTDCLPTLPTALLSFGVAFPSLLLEVQHPVRHLTARCPHHIHNRPQLPRIIFSIEGDGLACEQVTKIC